MTIKDQFSKIKDNWLIIAVVIILMLFVTSGGISRTYVGNSFSKARNTMDVAESIGFAGNMPMMDEDFAPEIEERKKTKTAYLSSNTKRGQFKSAEQQLRNAVSASDSYFLNENVNKHGTDRRSYFSGSFTIKVDTKKYDAFILQIKDIGKIQSFNENTRDITGQYSNTEIEITTEETRLARFQTMLDEATKVEDKIELTDRIFYLERSLQYLKDSLENLDQRVEYSTIHVTLTEERSEYANVVWIKLSELVKNLVNSAKTLLSFIFAILPWAIVFLIVRYFWKKVKNRV